MFFWENGFNLKERLVPQGLSNAASAAVEALKINSITEKLRKGRPAKCGAAGRSNVSTCLMAIVFARLPRASER